MTTAARFADAIIVNSHDTAENFSRAFGKGVECPPIVVAPLGLSIGIPPPTGPSLPGSPYFVMIGTIEPRKNHLMILNVWRSLRIVEGSGTPRLVLIGGRGWENENIIDMLERSPFLRGIVEEKPQVSDDEMVQLLRGARALLMPSFGEGYGMPVAEALALGVPALCSDTPALREVGGNVPEYIDPLDGPAWRSAILDYSAADSPRRSAQLTRLASWQPTTWEDHFQKVLALLQTLRSRRDLHKHN
jgi:glycosyltransferase involved in cell wall biosynthesis